MEIRKRLLIRIQCFLVITEIHNVNDDLAEIVVNMIKVK